MKIVIKYICIVLITVSISSKASGQEDLGADLIKRGEELTEKNLLQKLRIKQLQKDSIALETAIANLNAQNVQLNQAASDLKIKETELNELSNANKKLSAKVSSEQELRKELEDEKKKLYAEVEELEKEKENWNEKDTKKQNEKLLDEKKELINDQKILRKEKKELANEGARLLKELNDVEAKLTACEKENSSISGLKKEIESLKSEKKNLEQKNAKHTEKLKKYGGVLSQILTELDSNLKSLELGSSFSLNNYKLIEIEKEINKYSVDFPNNEYLEQLNNRVSKYRNIVGLLGVVDETLANDYSEDSKNESASILTELMQNPNQNISVLARNKKQLLDKYCEVYKSIRSDILFLDDYPKNSYKREDIIELKKRAASYEYLMTELRRKEQDLSQKGTVLKKITCNL